MTEEHEHSIREQVRELEAEIQEAQLETWRLRRVIEQQDQFIASTRDYLLHRARRGGTAEQRTCEAAVAILRGEREWPKK